MKNRVLDGSFIEKEVLAEIRKKINGKVFFLAFISFEDSLYKSMLKTKCKSINIRFLDFKIDNPDTEKIICLINKLNQDKNITGIVIEEPIPKNVDRFKCYAAIDNNKDIDGVNYINQYYASINKPKLVNSTVLAVLKILDYYHIPLENKNVVVIGRSYNISRVLVNLLLNRNATVFIAHSKTRNLTSILKSCDIIISATGVNNLFRSSDLKDDSVVIDVGLGDVLVDKKNIFYTPKVKGVGVVSISLLLDNLIRSCN